MASAGICQLPLQPSQGVFVHPDKMELSRFLVFLGLVFQVIDHVCSGKSWQVSGRGGGHIGGRAAGRVSSSSGRSSGRASVGRSSSSSSGRSSYGSSGSSSYGSSSRYSSSYGSGSSYRSSSGSSSFSSGSRRPSSSLLYPASVASSGGSRAYGGWSKRGPSDSRQYGMQHQGYESAGYHINKSPSGISSSSRSSSVGYSFLIINQNSSQTGSKTALAAGAVGVGAGALTTGLVLNSYQEYRWKSQPSLLNDPRELQQQRGGRNLQLDCEGGCTGGAQCIAGLCACPEGNFGDVSIC